MRDVQLHQVEEKPYPSTVYAWFVVACLQVAYAIALVDRGILALVVQPIKSDMGLSDTQFSLLAGIAFALFYAVLGVVLGRFADHHNRRNLIVAGLVAWSMATIACGLARNYEELFAARMFVGVGEAALSPAAYSMIADYFPKERRARPTSFYTMGIFTGSGAALIFGATVVAFASRAESTVLPLFGELRSWQAVFVLVGLPGLVLALFMLVVREPERRAFNPEQASGAAMRAFLREHGKLIALIIAAFGLNGVIYYGIATWTPALFIRKFGWSAADIGYTLGIVQLTAGTAGILGSGWWIGRPANRGRTEVLLSFPRNMLMLMPVAALVLGMTSSQTVAVAALAVLVLLGGLVSALSAVALYQVTPNQFRGRIAAYYLLTGTLLGLGIGATLIAAITDYVFGNDKAVGWSCAIVYVAAALVAAACLRGALTIVRRGDVPEA